MDAPRVPLVIRVGVTGHRPERLDKERCRALVTQLTEVLSAIRDIAGRLLERAEASSSGNRPFSGELPVLRLISPLAEGADRIAARVALDLGYKLECPLPFHREAYKRDFETRESKEYFDLLLKDATVLELNAEYSELHGNSAAYAAVGELVLRHSDVLVAVWDRQAARGGGGTAEIVDEAGKRGIPVVCVDPRAELAPELRARHSKKDWKELLEVRLWRQLVPPPAQKKSVSDFYEEKWPRLNFGGLFLLLRGLFSRGSWERAGPHVSSPSYEAHARLTRLQLNTLQAAPRSDEKLEKPHKKLLESHEKLVTYYVWADRLAARYAGYYRASVPTIFLLSTLSVLCVLLSIIEWEPLRTLAPLFPGTSFECKWKCIWSLSELGLIIIILLIVLAARWGKWHRKWTDYRQLAERLRFIHVLWSLGFPESKQRERVTRVGGQRADWVPWFFLAVLRDVGMVHVRFSPEYFQWARQAQLAELAEQKLYHAHNAHDLETIHHRLEQLGWSVFVLTFLVCLVHLFEQFDLGVLSALLHKVPEDCLNVAAGVLPAIAAAFFAIRSHAEFKRLARHSSDARRALMLLRARLRRLHPVRRESLADVARAGFQVAMLEADDWREVFREKPVDIL